jgi:predicted NBD/HSP70 family sugar kinase
MSGRVLVRDDLVEAPATRVTRVYDDLLGDALGALTSLVQQAAEMGVAKEAIIGGGVIVPGTVDPVTGYVGLLPSLPGLRNTYVGRDLSQGMVDTVGWLVPFWVENDANAAGLVELRFGADRNVRDFAVLIFETGLGGALILNGSLYHGCTSRAGEIGHITVAPQGPLCPCGSKGCLETVASGRALLLAVRNSISPLAGKEDLGYRDVIQAARAGDQEVLGIFQRMGHYLGIGIANLVNILNPARVVLSGQLAAAAQFFLEAAEEEMGNRVFQGMNCELAVSGCLEDLEVRAALSTFLHYYSP